MAPDPTGPSTRSVHDGQLENEYGALSSPVYHSATFRFPTLEKMIEAFEAGPAGMVYTRYNNPTIAAVETRLAATEGAEAALAFASGMAAITSSLLAFLHAGDRILAQREIYGGSFEFLNTWAPKLGFHVDWFSVRDLGTLDTLLAAKPRLVYAETPTNPLLRLVDLERLAARAHAAGALLIVDNTFSTGYLQRPLALGADIAVHSATKYLGGHSDVIAGAAMGSAAHMAAVWKARKIFGGCIDPQAAWLLERSIQTLPLRLERACTNARAIAAHLAEHRFVERVHFPGLPSHPDHALAKAQMSDFGAVMSIELGGDLTAATRFVDHLELFQLAASLGGTGSLVSVPVASSHFALTPAERAEAGVTDGMVRLSVGIEDPADLIADLDQALVHASAGVEPARA